MTRRQKLAKAAARTKRLGLALGQVKADAAMAERAGHGYAAMATNTSTWSPDLQKKFLAWLLKTGRAGTYAAAAGSLIDLYGGLDAPELGSIADDWNAIGGDFAAVGGDLISALRSDLAKRSQK